MISEAKYDDESIASRNLEASYGLFSGRLDRFVLTSLSRHDLRGEVKSSETCVNAETSSR